MKRSGPIIRALVPLALSIATVQVALRAAVVEKIDFVREVQPLLAENCVKCHGPEKQKAGLRPDLKTAAMKGGDDGKVIEPGHSADSKLIQLVEGRDADKVMPPKGQRLNGDQISLLRRWIDQGADWPEKGKLARVRSEHWSLQALRLPAVPLVADASSEIDAFVRAKLSAHGLSSSPQADRRTLFRRLTFNLLGLPPPPAEIDAFTRDRSPRAYEA